MSNSLFGDKRSSINTRRWWNIPEWEDLPEEIRNGQVRPYYDAILKHRAGLAFKRAFDITAGTVMLGVLALPMAAVSVAIKLDSEGPVFYRQDRVTAFGGLFKIHKFRSMVSNADKIGTAVTVGGDSRITKMGHFMRKYRIDEFPQIFDVLSGDMSFVGTRPDVPKYVKQYQPEFFATLLLPAGITSEASIRYKDEEKLLKSAEDADKVYMEEVVPAKMKYNLEEVRNFSFTNELFTMIRTVLAVLGADYNEK